MGPEPQNLFMETLDTLTLPVKPQKRFAARQDDPIY